MDPKAGRVLEDALEVWLVGTAGRLVACCLGAESLLAGSELLRELPLPVKPASAELLLTGNITARRFDHDMLCIQEGLAPDGVEGGGCPLAENADLHVHSDLGLPRTLRIL